MARGKNATALFEVIHTAKKPPKSSPVAAMPTPRWWAKDKLKLPAPAPQPGETAGKQSSWLAAVKKSAAAKSEAIPDAVVSDPVEIEVEPEAVLVPAAAADSIEESPSDPAEVATPVDRPDAESAPRLDGVRWMARPQPAAAESDETPALVAEVKTRFADRFKDRARTVERTEEPAMPSRRTVGADGPSGLKVSVPTLVGACCVGALLLVLAYEVGTRTMSGTRSPAGGTGGAGTPGMPASSVRDKTAAVLRPDALAIKPRPPIVSQTPSALSMAVKPPADIPRVAGRSYFFVQRFLSADAAGRAAATLNGSGVPCTVVRGLKGYVPRDVYCVIGSQPFADPDRAEYLKRVRAAYLKFDPDGQISPRSWYVWRDDAEQG